MIIFSFCYVTSSVNKLLVDGTRKVCRGQRVKRMMQEPRYCVCREYKRKEQ